MSFAQGGDRQKAEKQIEAAVDCLKAIVDATWLDVGSQRSLKSFLQSATQAKDAEDDDLSLEQPQAKMVAYESKSGGIVATVEEMQGKAEDTLADLRKKEMTNQHGFKTLEAGLNDEIKHGNEKLGTATSGKAANQQLLEDSNSKNVETKKTKAADEEYASTLKTECESKAAEWDERQKSAAAEMGAIDKAKEILVSGVKVFVQVSTKMQKWSPDDEDEDDRTAAARDKVVSMLKTLSNEHHSFALAQMASAATSDPFVKIRGLIEDMIEKLLKEAQEDATHEAFCNEEMGKSTKSKDEKTMKLDKLQTRIDTASTTITELTESIKTLEAEVAEIDKAQSEATKVRTEEHEDYLVASKDFKDSAEAVAKATEVLKNFYEGSFIQISSKTESLSKMKDDQPELGGAKSDIASVIIGILEMS